MTDISFQTGNADLAAFDPSDVARKLVANGYRPVPCVGKAVKTRNWPEIDFTAQDFKPNHNVGIKTGHGVALIDIDVTEPGAAAAITAEWKKRHGTSLQRTGKAPKTAFLVASDLARKIVLKLPDLGADQKIEVLAKGQQFIAYGTHPDTREPYKWHGLDPLDSFLGVKSMLPFVSETEINAFVQWVKDTYGPKEDDKPKAKLSERAAPIRIDTGSTDNPFWRNVNSGALADLDCWVPALLPSAQKQATGAWRVASADLGRNLEEDLSLHPDGIQDFGDEVTMTAIDVVQKFGGMSSPKDAAFWLCDKMGVDPATLGWRDEARSAQGDAPEPTRSYDELMEAAKGLKPDQHDDVEAIVGESASLSPTRKEAVFREIKNATKIPLGTLRAQLSFGADAGPDPDHLDLARVTLNSIGRQNIICADAFVWQWSDAGVWAQQDDRAIKQATQNVIDTEGVDVTASLVNGVTDVLKSEIFKPGHQFNRGNPETVNCLNGELALDEIAGWHLEPHCRERYRTTQIPVEYDAKANAPMFCVFMEQVFQDDPDKADKTKALLELMGYTLMSHARHEKFVMLIGPGANGKSVLLGVLERLCGVENVAGVQPTNFDRSFQRAHLHQKLANIVTELKQGEVIADAELKAITSGEPATVEHKFKDPFVMRPFSTCWFGTNHMPHTRDFSEALFRRATILQFNRTFSKEEQDPLLKEKLLTELPGILNMAVRAYEDALYDGFTQPPSSEDAKKEWRLEADQVALFVDETCERVVGARTAVGEVFQAYEFWARATGISKTVSQKGLRDRLTRLGFGADRDRNTRYVTGLKVVAIAWGA